MQEKRRGIQVWGPKGESVAIEYLKENRFSIVERNFRARCGEIDIIAKKGGVLYFIEVKSRGAGSLIDPLEALDERQRRRIRRTAELYLMKNPRLERLPCSFAVIGVDHSCRPPRIECILDAFE
jgi:putative endonuclease